MRRAFTAFMLAVLALMTPVQADEPVVVELFTSQGCASCPPADALLASLAERSDVIPLALHVDYWDYIGWADSFASPFFTKRQKGYARASGARTIYTPQMIVGGRAAVVGHRPMELAEHLMQALEEPALAELDIARSGEKLDISVRAVRPLKGDYLLQLVRYRPSETVSIGRGENEGRTITYHNIVTDWQTIATWNGREPLALRHPILGTYPAVVLVQQANYGAIVAAARAP